MEAIVMPTLKHFRTLMGKNKTKTQSVINIIPMQGDHINQVESFEATEEALIIHYPGDDKPRPLSWQRIYKIELVQ